MRVGRVFATSVVGVASLIVISAAVIAAKLFIPSRNGAQQNVSPPAGQQAISPVGDMLLLSESSGNSSFLYRKTLSDGTKQRLSSARAGIESEASFSHDGKFVVYSFAPAPESKSSIWMVGIDGQNSRVITSSGKDALHPVFSPDDSKVFYAASSFTGNYSPIVRPSRHDWDVFSVPVHFDVKVTGAASVQITHANFYNLQSLDVTADPLNVGGTKILVSTTGYPIGALLEEFNLGDTGRDKIFQPHVPGESSVGPSFGEARFTSGGMDILFLAASNASGGNYDYNVYSMSDITGGEIKQTHTPQGDDH